MSMALRAVPRFLDELSTLGGLRGTDIANITEVSKATVSRWKAGDIKPQPRSELILSDLHYIVGRLQELTRRAKSGHGFMPGTPS